MAPSLRRGCSFVYMVCKYSFLDYAEVMLQSLRNEAIDSSQNELCERIEKLLEFVHIKKSDVYYRGGKRELSKMSLYRYNSRTDYNLASNLVLCAMRLIYNGDKPYWGLKNMDLIANHPMFFSDYIEIFLYSECSNELFSAIFYYVKSYYRKNSTLIRPGKEIKELLVSLIAKEILANHGKFITTNFEI